MTRSRRLSALVAGFVAVGCGGGKDSPALSRTEEADAAVPVVPVPGEEGPRLGALANLTPVWNRPSRNGVSIGYLHAGSTVARAAEPYSSAGCDGGWYPIRPAGFVCASGSATTELSHATLSVMSVAPDLTAPLPYTYARTVRDTVLYEAAGTQDPRVRPLSNLRARSGAAVVGSWTATDPSGKKIRLALTTEGRFVPAPDLESLEPSSFRGAALDKEHSLPLAFVVKRGVHVWSFETETPTKGDLLPYHAALELSARSRKVSGSTFLAVKDGRWVRERDVTVIPARHELPAFATGEQRWMDLSVITGALVAYVGARPWFATLASVGEDRLGAPESDHTTRRGEFDVVAKHVTLVGRDPSTFQEGASLFDVPWALELSSGQLLVGAYWHDRFGIEHGPGNVELSPSDAARLFTWATPELPKGWHGVRRQGDTTPRTIVNVRR